ncbi:zinc finger protein AEBP2 isoform X2 [Microcaecilia unicolor]|uniref:Zinc finger protein AEBP2 n=1 Tax=Microcaecilia unicolor TaxID=1415580 RepID=A0A6P7Z1N2_9AMPH|nr:zinc finger protein AEBP2 isoform X2 [Microcaecilia unicolor]
MAAVAAASSSLTEEDAGPQSPADRDPAGQQSPAEEEEEGGGGGGGERCGSGAEAAKEAAMDEEEEEEEEEESESRSSSSSSGVGEEESAESQAGKDEEEEEEEEDEEEEEEGSEASEESSSSGVGESAESLGSSGSERSDSPAAGSMEKAGEGPQEAQGGSEATAVEEAPAGETTPGSLEMDGEPLSRMDSEDSISSTLMDVDSTISSGRSTPAMMNGQGIAASSTKSISYSCCWDQCQICFNSSPDLADHIRSIHVDGQRGGVFVCLWKGCKVYNTPSTSQSWLQRHMLTHSGDKPFKCVVGGCNASFASQGGLARHVPTHFSQQNSSKVSSQPKAKEESPSKAGLNKRRKLKNKRKRSLPALGTAPYSSAPVQLKARPHDFFDAQTLDAIRHRAICFNLSAQIESLGNGHSVVFHSTVMAKRKEDSGKIKILLHWTPEDILPDVWVNESERHQLKTKVVHLSKLPKDTALLLDPNIYRTMPQKRLKRR